MNILLVEKTQDQTKIELATEIYSQVCNSIRTTDEVSFRLLGLVPLVSAAGIFGISLKPEIASSPLLLVISLFAAAVTIALFKWELRNLDLCHWYLNYAIVLEENIFYGALGNLGDKVSSKKKDFARGQFTLRPDTTVERKRTAETIIYGATISAWIAIGTYALISLIFPQAMAVK